MVLTLEGTPSDSNYEVGLTTWVALAMHPSQVGGHKLGDIQ